MRRQTKKLALTLLLSAALVGANQQLVFAQEESMAGAEGSSSVDSSSEEADSLDSG